MFNEKYPNLLAATQYFGVLDKEVCNLKKAYRETCLCRTCFNNRRDNIVIRACSQAYIVIRACVVRALTTVCSVKTLQ